MKCGPTSLNYFHPHFTKEASMQAAVAVPVSAEKISRARLRKDIKPKFLKPSKGKPSSKKRYFMKKQIHKLK